MSEESFLKVLELLNDNPSMRSAIQLISILILLAGLYRYMLKPSWRFHWKLFEAAEKIRLAYPVLLKMAEDFKPNGGRSLRDCVNRIEDRQRESEGLIVALLTTTPNPLFRADATGKWIWVNRAWSEVSGFLPEQALGYGWLNCICSDYQNNISLQWKLAVDQQRDSTLEFDLITKDDRTIPVRIEATILKDNGHVLGYVGRLSVIPPPDPKLIHD